jgi:hypothetical protein
MNDTQMSNVRDENTDLMVLCSNEYQHTLITWSSSVIMCAETSQRNKNNHVGFHPTENLNQVNKLTAQHDIISIFNASVNDT